MATQAGSLPRRFHIKKTKTITTKELPNFTVDNEDMEIVKYFMWLGSIVISPNGDCRQAAEENWDLEGQL